MTQPTPAAADRIRPTLMNAVRRSLCLALAAASLFAGSIAGDVAQGHASCVNETSVSTQATGEDALARGPRIAPSRKAVIGYWSGTRVC